MKAIFFFTACLFTLLQARASVVVSPTFVNFGLTSLNQSAIPRTIGIQNRGSSAVEMQVVEDTCASDFSVNAAVCSRRLAPQETCTMQAQFVPVARGVRNCTIEVREVQSAAQTIKLTGTGIVREQDNSVQEDEFDLDENPTMAGDTPTFDRIKTAE